MQNRWRKFPLCFSSKLLADLCTHFTPKSYALFTTKRQLRETSDAEVLVYYFSLLYKIRRPEMLLQWPAPCSSDSTVQHYENLPSNFFIVNKRSNPVKTPQYMQVNVHHHFHVDYVLYLFSSLFPRQWRQFRCLPSPTAPPPLLNFLL